MAVLVLILAFACGSIPFGVLIGNMMGVDVRSQGSGNIGATNVYRVLGWKAGTAVFLLDVGKGVVGPILARTLLPGNFANLDWIVALAGIFAVLGHSFSPFLKFKGGKGIATSLGALLGMIPFVGLCALAAWLVLMVATRIVSVASIAACIALPIAAFAFQVSTPFLVVSCIMSLVAFLKHIPNMKRLRAGTEPKFGEQKPETVPVKVSAEENPVSG